MKNEFEEMYDKDDFNNELENEIENEIIEPITAKTNSDKIEDEEVTFDDYVLEEYIKTPDVDESVTFVVDRIVTVKDPKRHHAINKKDGEEFIVGVKKDDQIIRKDIITDDGKRFIINSWGLFYLFISKKGKFADAVRKNGGIKGIKIKLTRKYDGSVPKKNVKDVMKLYDFETEEEAINYQKEVATAMKEGRLFELEILD